MVRPSTTPEEKSKANAARRASRQARREQGLCWHCNTPAVPGLTRCPEHLKDASAWWNAKGKYRR